jgi:hypothetical protein
MNNRLSPICKNVVILDFTGKKIVKYAEVVIPETPGAWRKPQGDQRCYLAHFADGTTNNFFSQFPVHHLPPSFIEGLHRKAYKIHISMLADLYASILDMPRRKREVI